MQKEIYDKNRFDKMILLKNNARCKLQIKDCSRVNKAAKIEPKQIQNIK